MTADEREFIPVNIIDSLKGSAKIEEELDTCHGLVGSVGSLIEYILNKPAIKIFLTLAACDLTTDMPYFHGASLSDDDFPINRYRDSDEDTLLSLKSGRDTMWGAAAAQMEAKRPQSVHHETVALSGTSLHQG
jgi:hypothetical protein